MIDFAIAPSILSADMSRLGEEVDAVLGDGTPAADAERLADPRLQLCDGEPQRR